MKLMLTTKALMVTTAFVKLLCMDTGNQLNTSLVLLLSTCVIITFRSTALAILRSRKWEQAMKFRSEVTNETPLRMLIQHMPGQFSENKLFT